MNLRQLAKAHEISSKGVRNLHDAIIRAREAYGDAWGYDTQVAETGRDSLEKVRTLLEQAYLELVMNSANEHALRKEGFDPGETSQAIAKAMYNTTAAYQPKRRGPASKKSARALVSVLAGYWVKQLGRDFTQYWVGKDKDGIPVPASAASQFVLDVAGMINIDVRDVPALKRACAEQVATLRKKAPGGRNS